MSEDMDPAAYAETLAGQAELLRRAVKNFFRSVHQELGKLLETQPDDVLGTDRHAGDGTPDSDPDLLLLWGRCGAKICEHGEDQHGHTIIFSREKLRDLADTAPGRDEVRKRDPNREPVGQPEQTSCARGEPCPAVPNCPCSCEHYHKFYDNFTPTSNYGPPNSRNTHCVSERHKFTIGHFYCAHHGWRVELHMEHERS